jgi:hypothetical protein
VNPWVGPFEALTEQVDADWTGVWALACTSHQAFGVVQERVLGAIDDWLLNLGGYFIICAFLEVISAHPEAEQSAVPVNARGLEFGDRDGALDPICLLLNSTQHKLTQLAVRDELNLCDQRSALCMRRYLESAALTIARVLDSGSESRR